MWWALKISADGAQVSWVLLWQRRQTACSLHTGSLYAWSYRLGCTHRKGASGNISLSGWWIMAHLTGCMKPVCSCECWVRATHSGVTQPGKWRHNRKPDEMIKDNTSLSSPWCQSRTVRQGWSILRWRSVIMMRITRTVILHPTGIYTHKLITTVGEKIRLDVCGKIHCITNTTHVSEHRVHHSYRLLRLSKSVQALETEHRLWGWKVGDSLFESWLFMKKNSDGYLQTHMNMCCLWIAESNMLSLAG